MKSRHLAIALVILLTQVAAATLLYWLRIRGSSAIVSSDVVVFSTPVLAAVAGHGLAVVKTGRAKTMAEALWIGLGLAAVGFFVSMLVALNLFGS